MVDLPALPSEHALGVLLSLLTPAPVPDLLPQGLPLHVHRGREWGGGLLLALSLSEVWETSLNNRGCRVTGKFIKKRAPWETCLHKTQRYGQIYCECVLKLGTLNAKENDC